VLAGIILVCWHWLPGHCYTVKVFYVFLAHCYAFARVCWRLILRVRDLNKPNRAYEQKGNWSHYAEWIFIVANLRGMHLFLWWKWVLLGFYCGLGNLPCVLVILVVFYVSLAQAWHAHSGGTDCARAFCHYETWSTNCLMLPVLFLGAGYPKIHVHPWPDTSKGAEA